MFVHLKNIISLFILLSSVVALVPHSLAFAVEQENCELSGGLWDACAARDWSAYCLDEEGEMRTHRDPSIIDCEQGCICPNGLFFNGESCVPAVEMFSACHEVQAVDMPTDDPTSPEIDEDQEETVDGQVSHTDPSEDETELPIPEELDSVWGDGLISAEEYSRCAQAGGQAVLGGQCTQRCLNTINWEIEEFECLPVITDYCDCPYGQEFVDNQCVYIDIQAMPSCDGGAHDLDWDQDCLESNLDHCGLVCTSDHHDCLDDYYPEEEYCGNEFEDDYYDFEDEYYEDETYEEYESDQWLGEQENSYEIERERNPSLSLEEQVGCDAQGAAGKQQALWILLLALVSLVPRKCLKA